MQKKMGEAQARLDEVEVVGEAGAGMVKVTMSAKGEPKRVSLDKSAIDPDEPEILEDVLLAALIDAKDKVVERLRTGRSGAEGRAVRRHGRDGPAAGD